MEVSSKSWNKCLTRMLQRTFLYGTWSWWFWMSTQILRFCHYYMISCDICQDWLQASNKCPDKSPRTHGLLDLHFLFWTEDIFFKKWRRTERELLCENLLFSTEAISRLCSMSTHYSDSGMKWWGQEWTQTSQLLIQCSLLTEFIDSKC